MITEVFVSNDGLNYTKLDLHKDESISMKYTQKDLQDISKIFSPYSMSFTFPATPKNRAAFGFFGDTEVIKINTENKFPCKIYNDGVLNLTGFILLSDLKYKNNTPTDFTGNFATSMTNLKDRIGDLTINNLTTELAEINWIPSEVFSLLKGSANKNIDGVNVSYFIPLISSERVWSVGMPGSALKDNVAYVSTNSPTGNNVVKSTELRPAISFSSIIELIKKKFELQVICPLDERPEYKDLFVWCNSETFFSPKEVKLNMKKQFAPLVASDTLNEYHVPNPRKYASSIDLTDESFKIIKQQNQNEWDKFCDFTVRFENVLITGSTDTPSVNVRIVRKSTSEILISKQVELVDNKFDCTIQLADTLFISNQLEFYVYVQFNQPTTFGNCYVQNSFYYRDGKFGAFNKTSHARYTAISNINDNASDVAGTKIDLFRSLPKIKVADFLTSYFKMFNISVFDTSPNDENLYWLTPEDIQTKKKAYSKSTLDYTPFVNISEFKKSNSTDYNYYNFKHATSKYKSNIDFLSYIGTEYGQVLYPLVKPANPVEFKVETTFTLMVPVLLAGSYDTITYYGFGNDAPEILETGEVRYKANYGELTIFYNNGNSILTDSIGVQNNTGSGVLIVSELTSYMKVLPWNKDSNSLGFSILTDNNLVNYTKSLYENYYKNQITRLLNPNVLSQEYSLTLPASEIYLNDATSFQGQGETPTGFRLQNDIIVGENLFTILDATIDITTGKTKLTLLNF